MSPTFRTGLVLLGLLSVGDLATPLLSDGEHPPMAIALAGSVLGLVSLVLIYLAARGSRGATIGLIVLRVLSALSAVPAFTESGVPAAARIAAGVGIVLTVIGVGLLLVPSRQAVAR